MVNVAREMERQDFKVPLLIGGATTSPAHTSVKIAPNYTSPVVYVKDASRSVGVCQSLITPTARDAFIAKVNEDHVRRREQHANKKVKAPQLSIEQARANRRRIDWQQSAPVAPRGLRIHRYDNYPLDELLGYIDWMPFFNAWEFAGKFPGRADRPGGRRGGEQPLRRCAPHAEAAHRRALAAACARWSGSFPANAVGDDVEIYTDASRSQVATTLCFLRQQKGKAEGQPHECLADYIAPKASGVADYIGAFAVTAGIGIEEHVDALRACARRLLQHHAQGARGSSCRSLRRAFPRARAPRALGLCLARDADQRAADPRGVPRHPPRAGLSRLPGSHREGEAVGAARCRRRTRASASPNPSRCIRPRR